MYFDVMILFINPDPRLTRSLVRLCVEQNPVCDWLVTSTNQRCARLDETAASDTCGMCLQNGGRSPRAASQSARAPSKRIYAIGRSWRGWAGTRRRSSRGPVARYSKRVRADMETREKTGACHIFRSNVCFRPKIQQFLCAFRCTMETCKWLQRGAVTYSRFVTG